MITGCMESGEIIGTSICLLSLVIIFDLTADVFKSTGDGPDH